MKTLCCFLIHIEHVKCVEVGFPVVWCRGSYTHMGHRVVNIRWAQSGNQDFCQNCCSLCEEGGHIIPVVLWHISGGDGGDHLVPKTCATDPPTCTWDCLHVCVFVCVGVCMCSIMIQSHQLWTGVH